MRIWAENLIHHPDRPTNTLAGDSPCLRPVMGHGGLPICSEDYLAVGLIDGGGYSNVVLFLHCQLRANYSTFAGVNVPFGVIMFSAPQSRQVIVALPVGEPKNLRQLRHCSRTTTIRLLLTTPAETFAVVM